MDSCTSERYTSQHYSRPSTKPRPLTSMPNSDKPPPATTFDDGRRRRALDKHASTSTLTNKQKVSAMT